MVESEAVTIAAARDHFTVFERENLTITESWQCFRIRKFCLTLPLSSSSRGHPDVAEFATLHASRIGDGHGSQPSQLSGLCLRVKIG